MQQQQMMMMMIRRRRGKLRRRERAVEAFQMLRRAVGMLDGQFGSGLDFGDGSGGPGDGSAAGWDWEGGIPPPPPMDGIPPPPPMFGAKAVKNSVKPSCRTKLLQWSKIPPRKVNGTLWQQVNNWNDDYVLDFTELETMHEASQESASKRENGGCGWCRGHPEEEEEVKAKPGSVTVVDPERIFKTSVSKQEYDFCFPCFVF